MSKKLTIGLVGFGCVGSGLYEVLNQSELLDAEIKKIIVKDPIKKRSISPNLYSFDVRDILNDKEINVVVELIDDSVAAKEIVLDAFKAGKSVVSANKKLIAEHLDELLQVASENQVSFLYEGAVAGSIPIIRNLEEYYNNDALTTVEGIVNGTTNFILTQVEKGLTYKDALKVAQEKGFAESDPTSDVDGFDSKYKLSLLIRHAFGLNVHPADLLNVGIRRISPNDVEYAREKGMRIKLISRSGKIGDKVFGFVAPHFITGEHPAFAVNDEFNAVTVQGLFSNQQLFYGKGAGSHPTASAVLSDISALKFDYKYEYRKCNENNELEFTEDYFLKVYIGSKYPETLRELPFYRIDEAFQSEKYAYQIGWVRFSDIVSIPFNRRSDISLIVFSDKIKIDDQVKELSNERVRIPLAFDEI